MHVTLQRTKRKPAAAVHRTQVDVLARLTLDYWRDGPWWVGQLREAPAVISQGKSLVALRRNIRDAYRLVAGRRRA